MSNYDNNNRGSIWKNEDRKSSATHPQFKGSAEVNGVEYWVSGWLRKEGANTKIKEINFKHKGKKS
jgi:hypothetical protein